MKRVAAFVGHSFLERDGKVVQTFLSYFDDLESMGILHWDHAEAAEPRELSEKVKAKMNGKNVFIGICTAREIAVDRSNATNVFGRYIVASRESSRLKTSDWILQEIGMAIGRDMKLILLVEKGITRVGGLQGDIEYIPFAREHPADCYGKILQMLQSLQAHIGATSTDQPSVGGVVGASSSKEADVSQEIVHVKDRGLEPSVDWTIQDYVDGQLYAILVKNAAAEERIVRAFATSVHAADPYSAVLMEAYRIYYHQKAYAEPGLQSLRALCDAHPSHADAHLLLALMYRKLDDFAHAAEQETVCWRNALNELQRVGSLFRCARDYKELGNTEAEQKCLKDAESVARSHPDTFAAYCAARAGHARAFGPDHEFFAYAEWALKDDPSANSRRFDLALKYNEANLEHLSYYHYQIRIKAESDATSLNNLAVAAEALSLPGKGVSAYLSAMQAGQARAHGNLADRYASAGFFAHAEECIKGGAELDSTDDRVGAAAVDLKELKRKEDEAEAVVISRARAHQRYLVTFAEALEASDCPPLDATDWDVGGCIVTVTVSGSSFEAKGTYERRRGLGIGNALVGALPGSSRGVLDHKDVVTVEYSGVMRGRAVRATRTEKDSGAIKTLLSESAFTKEVLLVISPSPLSVRELALARSSDVKDWTKRAEY
jgi:hypothetical protein